MLKPKTTVPPEFNWSTGERADRKGFYYPACCAGTASPELICIALEAGEVFPRCPRHDKPTMWRLHVPADEGACDG